MIKILLPFMLICFFGQVSAQKIFQTKTGIVKFYSVAPLENIEAIHSQVNSKLTDGGQMAFALLIRGFVFKNALMQEHFNENYMESNLFPKASFNGKIDNIKDIDFSKNGVYQASVSGELDIHGVKQPLKASGTIEVNNGKVSIKSSFKINIQSFGIKGKYIGEKIAKDVDVTIDCKYE